VEEPLLLHSLTAFRELIEGCLEATGAATVCEIGSETGGHTHDLVAWAERHDAHVWCVEPHPVVGLRELAAQSTALTLVRGRSPGALADVPACDAWIVDGDHNYATVASELRTIVAKARAADRPALAILHDVGWPAGRRDSYYAPQAIDDPHPHTWSRGVVPGEPGVVDGGFRGGGEFAWAEREGGTANGVRAAVEAVAAEEGLELLVVPSVFGLGFLFAPDAPWAGIVQALVAPLAGAPLLERLERNRVALYLRVLALQDEAAVQGTRVARVAAGYEQRIGALEAELSRLRHERIQARD